MELADLVFQPISSSYAGHYIVELVLSELLIVFLIQQKMSLMC